MRQTGCGSKRRRALAFLDIPDPCREIRGVAGLCVCLRARPARSCLISSKVIYWANILAKDEAICGVVWARENPTRPTKRKERDNDKNTRRRPTHTQAHKQRRGAAKHHATRKCVCKHNRHKQQQRERACWLFVAVANLLTCPIFSGPCCPLRSR